MILPPIYVYTEESAVVITKKNGGSSITPWRCYGNDKVSRSSVEPGMMYGKFLKPSIQFALSLHIFSKEPSKWEVRKLSTETEMLSVKKMSCFNIILRPRNHKYNLFSQFHHLLRAGKAYTYTQNTHHFVPSFCSCRSAPFLPRVVSGSLTLTWMLLYYAGYTSLHCVARWFARLGSQHARVPAGVAKCVYVCICALPELLYVCKEGGRREDYIIVRLFAVGKF